MRTWAAAATCVAFVGCGEPTAPPSLPPVPVSFDEAAVEKSSLSGDVIAAAEHFRRGFELAAQGGDTEAVAAYRLAIGESPAYVEAHYNLGNALARQFNYPASMKSFSKVLELDSTHISARHNLAALYVKQLNYAQAIAEHQTVLRLDENHVATYYDLAYIYFIRGEYEQVEKFLNHGQLLAPQDARFPRLRGRMRHKQLRYAEAVAALRTAVQIDSTDAVTYADLAQAQLKAGEYEVAVITAERSIDLDPHDKDPRFILTNALRRLDRGEEARDVLEDFRALDEVESEIRKNLRILGNDPGDHEARAMLGLLYAGQGKFAEATEAYRLAVFLAPDSAHYHNNLGNYYQRTGMCQLP
ncbi:MAG: tetratricopeptide repeat protein [Candidatus Latescibacterota bacterium]|nr:tetratricopeptide repeat protein [Candidatus Latescibacterota bacterium]